MSHPLTLSDGLSQNSVQTILYDSEGYLWIGTKYGLNRYDYQNISNYYADPLSPLSLTDNNVLVVHEDATDTVWVAGESGLSRYDRRDDCFVPLLCEGKEVNVRSICDTPGGMLLGGAGCLYEYDRASGTIRIADTTGGSRLYYNRIHPWHDGRYLLETRWSGLWEYDPGTGKITRSPICDDRKIMVSYIDSDGNLWVSPYDEGLQCYAPDGKLLYDIKASDKGLSNNIVIDLIERGDRMWVGTESGIDLFDKETGVFSRFDRYLNDSDAGPGTVLRLYKDDFSNMYAGTLRHGIVCIYSVPMRSYTHPGDGAGMGGFTLTSLYGDPDGTVWCGIDGSGVTRFDPLTDSFRFYSSTSRLKVTWVSPYSGNKVLLSTYDKGFFVLDKDSGSISAAGGPYQAFAEDNSKKALSMEVYPLDSNRDAVVTDRVYVIDRSSGTCNAARGDMNASEPDKMYVFYQDSTGMLLHGAHTLMRYDVASDSMIRIADFGQDVTIRCAQFDGFRTVYAGTSGGLCRYDINDGSLTQIDTRIVRNIQSLVLEGKRLWIGADNILYLLNDGNLQTFNQSDGVVPNEFIGKSHLLTDDYVFMGGINGLQKINRVEIDHTIPASGEIMFGLSDITIDGVSKFASVNNGHIDVPSSHSAIAIKVIAREQNAMRRKLFRFNVDGLNLNGPIETFDRTFTLNAIPDGNYKVSVACSRPDGSWTDPVEIVELNVLCPWWRSWWAIPIYIALGLLAIYMAYRLVAGRKKRQMEDLKRTALEREVGLLTNINYELRTPLTLIYSPLKILIGRLKRSGTDMMTVSELENIYRHTKEMRDVIDMPLELWHVETTGSGTDPEPCDFNEWLSQEVADSEPAMELRRMHVDYSLDSNVGTVTFDRTRMGVVLANMLMAAVKHSPKGSTLSVMSKRDGDTVRVEIHDQGDILSDTEIQQIFSGHYSNQLYGAGFGLAYARMLMDMQHGHIGVRSNDNESGVTIWFELPVEPLPVSVTDVEAESVDASDELTPSGSMIDEFDTSGSTAIVVEDNEDLCMFMVSHLQEIFKKVYYAFNGRDAMLMIKRDSPDIVIADGVLPVLGGFDLCRDIKTSPELQHIPVILLTAGSAESEKLKSYVHGADSYISKPFDMNVLISRCKNLLLNRDIMRNRYRNAMIGLPVEEKLSNADESFLLKIDQLIASEISSPDFGVDRIVEKMLVSRSALYTRFKELTGKSIGTHITEYRLLRAKEMLRQKDMSVNEISEALGFRSQRYFSTFFKERTGVTPTAYRNSYYE